MASSLISPANSNPLNHNTSQPSSTNSRNSNGRIGPPLVSAWSHHLHSSAPHKQNLSFPSSHSQNSSTSQPDVLNLSEFPALGSNSLHVAKTSENASQVPVLSMDEFPALSVSQYSNSKARSKTPTNQSIRNSSSNEADFNSTINQDIKYKRSHEHSEKFSSNSVPSQDDRKLKGLMDILFRGDKDTKDLVLGSNISSSSHRSNQVPSGLLFSNFDSPWTDSSPYETISPDSPYSLPPCYTVNSPPPATKKMNFFSEETLFYIFYALPKDLLQEAAAQELFNRDWRYHKELKLWVTKEPGTEPITKSAAFERSTFVFFDPTTWKKMKREFVLVYEALEDRHTSMQSDQTRTSEFNSHPPTLNDLTSGMSNLEILPRPTSVNSNASNLNITIHGNQAPIGNEVHFPNTHSNGRLPLNATAFQANLLSNSSKVSEYQKMQQLLDGNSSNSLLQTLSPGSKVTTPPSQHHLS